MQRWLAMLGLGLALSAGSVARATDPATQSEYRRLTEQITSYAERNAWSAVSRSFEELEALTDAPITSSDLFLGAQAARALGDALTCQRRLLRAFEQNLATDFDPRAAQWLGELQKDYGRVDIKRRGNPARLAAVTPPFETDRKAAIDFAAERLTRQGEFDGLLPAGDYRLGEHSFTVEPGTERQKFRVRVRQEADTDSTAQASE